MIRKFNFEKEEDDEEAKAEASRAAIMAKLTKFDQQANKLANDEKRWLRKKRLATTYLKNITAAKRRLRARRKAFEKTLKG